MTEQIPPRRRRARYWAIGWFILMLVVVLSEYRGVLKAIKQADETVAADMADVSIWSFGRAFADHAGRCDPDVWFVCRPRKPPPRTCIQLLALDAPTCIRVPYIPPEPRGLAGVVHKAVRSAAAVTRMPEALFFVIGDRFRPHEDEGLGGGGLTPGLMTVLMILVAGGVAVFVARTNVLALVLMWPTVTAVMGLAFWIVQHILILLANGVGEVLQLLFVVGGVPLGIYGWILKDAHNAKEVVDGAHKVLTSKP
jgi:hypothetical protein